MTEQTITTRGFYLLLGAIIATFITYFATKSAYKYEPQPVKIEVTQKSDSIHVQQIPAVKKK